MVLIIRLCSQWSIKQYTSPELSDDLYSIRRVFNSSRIRTAKNDVYWRSNVNRILGNPHNDKQITRIVLIFLGRKIKPLPLEEINNPHEKTESDYPPLHSILNLYVLYVAIVVFLGEGRWSCMLLCLSLFMVDSVVEYLYWCELSVLLFLLSLSCLTALDVCSLIILYLGPDLKERFIGSNC